MDFETLKERIAGRSVVVDENMSASNLRAFLNLNAISWRQFRKGITDEEITRNLKPNEVVITADRRFAYNLQERSILVPLTKTHSHQMQILDSKLGKRVGSPWSNVKTCPLCSVELNSDEITFWTNDHKQRHSMNPVVTVSSHSKRR